MIELGLGDCDRLTGYETVMMLGIKVFFYCREKYLLHGLDWIMVIMF